MKTEGISPIEWLNTMQNVKLPTDPSQSWGLVVYKELGRVVVRQQDLTPEELELIVKSMSDASSPSVEGISAPTFGQQMKILRGSLTPPLTQADLARETGISLDWLRKIEQEKAPKPGIERLVRIALSLGLSGDELKSFVKSYPFS